MATQNNGQLEAAEGSLPSMVCGIVGLVLSCVPLVGLVLGTIAIVLSVKANRRIKEAQEVLGGKGMATAGLVCGIIAVVFGFFYLIYWVIYGLILGALFTGGLSGLIK
jgi:hypothetical protein